MPRGPKYKKLTEMLDKLAELCYNICNSVANLQKEEYRMANRIAGVTEKIVECAKKEFLEKGFRDASMRTIAANAKTTPKSIYTRYGDKEGLFGALVSPALEALYQQVMTEQETYHQHKPEEQQNLILDQDFASRYDAMERAIIDHIYDNFTAFKLLVDCSKGTVYEDFMDTFVDKDVEYTLKYIEGTGCTILSDGRASRDLVEVLSQLHITGMFEAVHREMEREAAHIYIKQLREFFERGWSDLLSFDASAGGD